MTLLLFLSSGFVPVERFPGFLQPVVRADPLSLAGDALVRRSRGDFRAFHARSGDGGGGDIGARFPAPLSPPLNDST
ncbi:hypothetical protein [Streptosporangium roseum]|uniref:hypothetical protein n=1 Tax=Streptosporangium roseum TaxID=2001 RepID=UPI0012DCBB92|nr:hypothetical protein [Streptosporangium roseum]